MNAKGILIAILAAVALAAGAYGYAWYEGNQATELAQSERDAAREELETAKAAADERIASANTTCETAKASLVTERDVAVKRLTQLRTTRTLTFAVSALQQSNFGIAQQRVTEAATALKSTAPEGALMAIADRLKTTTITPSEDSTATVALLTSLIAEIDAAVGATAEPAAAE